MRTNEAMDGHYRVMLLKIFFEMKMSESTQAKISKIIGSYNKNEKEQKAKEILEIIQNCKTEEAVLKTLNIY